MNENKVSVIVHRGTHQIGGCCTEIKCGGSSIAIDIGSPLPGEENELLNIHGLTHGAKRFDALFLTHYHGDHIGEIGNVIREIPIYASPCCKEIILAYQKHLGRHNVFSIEDNRISTINVGEKIKIGNFFITALQSDHSAAGSRMYLIEAGGKRILHTGDFRLHGPERQSVIQQLSAMGKIDLLITEGTFLSRSDSENWTEDKVEHTLRNLYNRYKYCFVLCSTSNIDRIKSISEAILDDSFFVVNEFQKQVLEIAEKAENYVFHNTTRYVSGKYPIMRDRGFVMLMDSSSYCKNLLKHFYINFPDDTCIIYSMWSGYMEYENIKNVCDLVSDKLYFVHSSGHVVVQDLKALIEQIDPKRILVIHTEGDCLEELENADIMVRIDDGEEYFIR